MKPLPLLPSSNLAHTLVIIPAHNEAPPLRHLLPRLKKATATIVVVDDGSRDDTETVTQHCGVHVLKHDKRQGKGAALRSGMSWALTQKEPWIVTMDGDGQHDVVDVEKLVQFAKDHQSELAIGVRTLNRQIMPRGRALTNKVMTSILNHLTHLNLQDTQSGLRVFARRALQAMRFQTKHFEIESESILLAHQMGLRIDTCPIQTRYPPSQRSKIKPVQDTFRWVKFLSRTLRARRVQ